MIDGGAVQSLEQTCERQAGHVVPELCPVWTIVNPDPSKNAVER